MHMQRLSLSLSLALLGATQLLGCSGFLGDGGDDMGETGDAGDAGADFNAHCQAQANWDPAWVAFEDEVLVIVNQRRSEGATCGGETFGAAGPLVAEAQLRCAARLHSQDMSVRDFFDHTNPDGMSPWDRVDLTDYSGFAIGENIAWGQQDAAAVMDAWMNSPGHCSNIMNPDATEIGIGYYDGAFWTQVMGQR